MTNMLNGPRYSMSNGNHVGTTEVCLYLNTCKQEEHKRMWGM